MKTTDYTTHTKCRFCNSRDISIVIDLGKMPLAGGFLKSKDDFKSEKKYPLSLNICNECYLLQTSVSINPDVLFKDYFYFSSSIKSLIDHFNATAKEAKKLLQNKSFVVEIGCNDGEFLKALQSNGFRALGVDPASNVVKPLIKKGYPIINSFFNVKTAKKIIKNHGNADAIYSFHSMAHIPDMHEVIKGIKLLLKPDGYLAFEVHYLGNLIDEMQYDMIYHEHLHYYSLLTIKRMFSKYDMEVFNVKRNSQRAGSIIYFIQNKSTGKRRISPSVKKLINQELDQGLDKKKTFITFNNKITKTKSDLIKKINKLKKKNNKISGYGASGRGTVIMNYCNLNTKLIDFVVDDAPAKQGSFMPGTHNPIYASKKLIDNDVDYAIIFAWPFIKEVKKRNKKYLKKGKFITPLPTVKEIQ